MEHLIIFYFNLQLLASVLPTSLHSAIKVSFTRWSIKLLKLMLQIFWLLLSRKKNTKSKVLLCLFPWSGTVARDIDCIHCLVFLSTSRSRYRLYFYLKVQNDVCSWWTLWCGHARMVKKSLQGACFGPLVANWWVV